MDVQDDLRMSCLYTVKPVFSHHSKMDKMKVLKTGGILMQVKSSIKLFSVFKTYFIVFFYMVA